MQVLEQPSKVRFSSLVDLINTKASNFPHEKIFTFLANGDEETASLTYSELRKQAHAIGVALRQLDADGKRALLLYEPGLEFIPAFFGCSFGKAVAVPAYLPRPKQKDDRLRSIINNCEPAFVLTTSALLEKSAAWNDGVEELRKLKWIATDTLPDQSQDAEPQISGDDLALLQYTSGSTATPKGVMITHDNILSNLTQIDEVTGHSNDSLSVSWLPSFHDLGLIYGVIYPIFKGFRCFHLPPLSFLQRPVRWLQAISRYRATHSIAPSFAYDLCTRKLTEEQTAGLDLSCWLRAGVGAEPVRKETLEAFAEKFRGIGFRATFCPGYGLAEATLKVTMVDGRSAPMYVRVRTDALAKRRIELATEHENGTQTLVGCGPASPETIVEIVNPDNLKRCTPDEVGEIWVKGPSVSSGYWQAHDATVQTFNAFVEETGAGPFLRTGDLGFLSDGQLFIVGRLKDLIIIDGKNHYPQDIELTAEQSHPAMRGSYCGAFSVPVDGEEKLVIVAELDRSQRRVPKDEIRNAIRKAVAEQHGLAVHDIVLPRLGSIPKTSSGKIQRQACRTNYLNRIALD